MLAIVVVNQSIMAWPPPSKQPTVNPAKPFTAHFATEPAVGPTQTFISRSVVRGKDDDRLVIES